MTAPAAATNGSHRTAEFRTIGLAQLHESPWNPRKRFDPADLEQLCDSICEKGILTPMLARPRTGGGFEIAAGHRRRRAAGLAEAKLGRSIDAPVMVREMSDVEFLEVLVFENDHRADPHPLEEAEGFRRLMESAGYDVARLAKRAGRQVDYVYDRLRLLELIPKAKELFLADRFSLGHAILLARLVPEDQERAIKPGDRGGYGHSENGIWQMEITRFIDENDKDDSKDPYAGLKPISVKEFQSWIDGNVRFDTDAHDVAELFPETADQLIAAEESELKVVHITWLHQTPDPAKGGEQRIFTVRAWERADGEFDSKTCEHSVLGAVVIGPGRGDTFAVCMAKDKCRVHYADRIREREKREREASKNGATSAVARNREADERDALRRQREEEARDLQRARWKKASSAVAEAVAERVKKASVGALVDVIREVGRLVPTKRAADLMPQGRGADEALRYLAFGTLFGYLGNEYQVDYAMKLAGRMGVDVKKLLDEHAPIEKADKAKAGK